MQARALHRRHARHLSHGNALQGPPPQAAGGPSRPHHRRLPAAHVGRAIGGKRFENRTQEVSAISRGLKAVAKELKVPVVALSQLSRAPESRGRRPSSATLRPARIGLHRAGRRRRGLHLPRRGVQEKTTPTSKASPKSSSPNSATAPSASSSSPSCTPRRASKTSPTIVITSSKE